MSKLQRICSFLTFFKIFPAHVWGHACQKVIFEGVKESLTTHDSTKLIASELEEVDMEVPMVQQLAGNFRYFLSFNSYLISFRCL